MPREVAVFINERSAHAAGQAAIQEKGGVYAVHRRSVKGETKGYVVELRQYVSLEGAPAVYIMET